MTKAVIVLGCFFVGAIFVGFVALVFAPSIKDEGMRLTVYAAVVAVSILMLLRQGRWLRRRGSVSPLELALYSVISVWTAFFGAIAFLVVVEEWLLAR